MIDLAVNGYSYEAVRDVLHFRKGGREVSFRYDLLGKGNVYKRALEVEDGEISLNMEAEIQRTGRFSFRETDDINWQVDRIKPWFRLKMPDGGFAEWPLGVLYMPTHPRTRTTGRNYVEVEAFDLSYALQQDAYTYRYTIRRGTPYIAAVQSVLNSAGIRQIIYDESAETLSVDRDWEIGTSKAQIVADLLAAVNYNGLTVTADGVFSVTRYRPPEERTHTYMYDAGEMSVVDPGGTLRLDTFDIPNVFVGVVSGPEAGGMRYAYEIDNPANPFSSYNRDGRRVVKMLRYNDIASQDVLRDAVHRAAYEASQVYETTTFTTAIMPHHEGGDILYLAHDAANGRYEETHFTLPLEPNGQMRHDARKLVYL